MPSRIALVLHNLQLGGAERVMLRLSGEFARRGAAVDVVTLAGSGPLAREVPEAVRHVELGAARVSRSLTSLARFVRRERPHAVVATLPHVNLATAMAVALAGVGPRLVLREANDPEHEHRVAGPRGAVYAVATRWAYGRAHHVVALTQGNADGVARVLGVARERITVIPNPAPPEAPPEAPPGGVADEPAGPSLPSGSPRLLCVARLARQKDHATLLRAFARFLPIHPHAVLALVGDGAERGDLERLAADLGIAQQVHFAGTDLHTARWWRWADVFALSSRWEGFPNVLLEAMQWGVPIVSADCPTGPREVLDGGRYGVLVPVGDPVALAGGLDRALAEPVPADRLRARVADFAIEAIGARWWHLLWDRP